MEEDEADFLRRCGDDNEENSSNRNDQNQYITHNKESELRYSMSNDSRSRYSIYDDDDYQEKSSEEFEEDSSVDDFFQTNKISKFVFSDIYEIDIDMHGEYKLCTYKSSHNIFIL